MMTSLPSNCYRIGFRYTLPFCNRFGIHTSLNTCSFRQKLRQYVDPLVAGFVYERGMKASFNVKINPDGPVYDDYEETLKTLTEGAWTSGFSLSVDENKIDIKEFSDGWDEDWETRYNKYPYDKFDDAFGKLYMEEKALDSYLAEYVRANSEYFK